MRPAPLILTVLAAVVLGSVLAAALLSVPKADPARPFSRNGNCPCR